MKKIISFVLTATLVFSFLNVASADFKDVPSSHSNYKDINFLLEKGVIEDGTTFGVNVIVTREEVAVMVAKAVGLSGTPVDTKFPDVKKNNKNSGYIQAAADAGIINGYTDGTFKPNQKVTRGHMAAFIARAFILPDGTKTFTDVPKGSTSYEAVSKLAAAGITTGYLDGTFKPNNNLTRGHISAFLARAIAYQESLIEEEITPAPTPQPDSNPTNQLGKSRNSAAKINQTVSIDVDDWLDGKQVFDLTLTEVISGQKAWSIIEDANMFNDAPEAGMQYVLAKIKVKIHSLEKEPFDINHAQFDAVSKNGSMYNDFISVVTPKPNLSTDLYSGAEYEGWTYFLVEENDSPKIVYRSGWDSERWFDLGL